jgi:hypothetical protein
MTLHINRFIDKIKAAESRQQRDVTMSIHEARDLHADITKILLRLETQQERTTNDANEVITVVVDGGKF